MGGCMPSGDAFRYVIVTIDNTNYLTLCEVEVMGVPVEYNLAKGKSAVQKSIGWGGDPNRAIDGNTDSNYGGNSCTHTQSSDHSWWSVDLGVPSKVESVKIYNRQDCCSDRLTDPIVYLSNEQPSEGQDLNTGAYTECGRFNGQVGESVNLGCMPSGDAFRYVIVTIDNTNFLTLCEVEVMGVPVEYNLAKGKRAVQKSIGWGGDP